LLDAVEGPSPGDRFAIARPQRPYRAEVAVAPRGLRIAFHADGGADAKVDAECVAAVEAVARLCASLGHQVEPAKPAYDEGMLADVNLCYWSSFTAGAVLGLSQMLGRTPSAENLEPCVFALFEHGLKMRAVDLERADVLANIVCRSVAPFFETHDVLLTPTVAAPPLPLGTMHSNRRGLDAAAYLRDTFAHVPFTALYNLTGQPAMSLPLASSRSGLPIGIQLVARYGDEATLFNLAGQLEQALPWAQRKPAVHVSRSTT
jgi:amidase